MLSQHLRGAGGVGGSPYPLYVSYAETLSSGTLTTTVTAPASIVDGGLLVAYLSATHADPGNDSVWTCSGFTAQYNYSNSNRQVSILTKPTSGESGNYSFVSDAEGSDECQACLMFFSDAPGGVDTVGAATENNNTSTLTPSAITPSTQGTLLFLATRPQDDITVTTRPSGMTAIFEEEVTAPGMWTYYKENQPASSTGSLTLTLGNTRPSWYLLMQIT